MLNGNVLVKLIADENTTKSGLVLIEKTKYYKIVEVIQPDSENVVKKGDKMYVPINAGTEVKIEKEELLIVNVRDIILIL
jgi:co-chaperonin GroES (HSP10)